MRGKIISLASVVVIVAVLLAPMVLSMSMPVPIPVKSGSYHADLRPGTSVNKYWSWNDYPYAVPFITPYQIVIAKDVAISNFKGPITLSFKTPVGEFSRILMRVDVWMTSAAPGRPAVNYDRPLWVWIDGVPAYMGTTVERYNQTAFADVTHLYTLLVGGKEANVSIALPSWVIVRWGLTGIFHVRVTLLYYPGIKPSVPDKIIPLFNGPERNNAWRGLATTVLNIKHPKVSQTITIPKNTVRAYLLVYTEGSAHEEFWYYYTPPDKYLIFNVDNKTMAFMQPYPYIFTGGIDLFLWRPISSIRTYSFAPHIIDITPFLPLLIGQHNITLKIFNIQNYWHVFAALLLYTDPNAYKVSGQILEYNYTGPIRNYNESSSGGVEKYNITSSMKLTVLSKIDVYGMLGEYSYISKASMENKLVAFQSFNNIWANDTMYQYWSYSAEATNVTPSWESSKVIYSWSDKWNSFLKVEDEFNIKAQGNPEQATPQHPVYGNFSEQDWITESLNIERTPWPFTNTPRSLSIELNGEAYINGTIMLIGPNAGLITGISAVGGNTTKSLKSSEVFNNHIYIFSRKLSGGNHWPKWWISQDKVTFVYKELE